MEANARNRIDFSAAANRHLLVALSGGADSTALTCLLAAASKELNIRITCAHYNHGIRAGESDRDEEACRALCHRLSLPLICERGNVPALAQARHQGLETAARDARHAFLRRARTDCGADWIALAHHMDDQAETVLMHLLRGAGPNGIAAMRKQSGIYYRPLLDCTHHELVDWLQANGFDWCEDSSNTMDDNPRNALRLYGIPAIERSYPAAVRSLARYARAAQIENDYIACQARAFAEEHLRALPFGWRMDLSNPCEEALARRALMRCIGVQADAAMLDKLWTLISSPRGKADLGGGLRAEKTPGALYLLKAGYRPPSEVLVPEQGTVTLDGICRLNIEPGDAAIERNNPLVEVLDRDELPPLVLRTRRAGDRMHPLGAAGERLLSDILIDRKIDRPMRDLIPLLASGSRVYWAGGIGIAAEVALKAHTRNRVRFTVCFPTEDKSGGSANES